MEPVGFKQKVILLFNKIRVVLLVIFVNFTLASYLVGHFEDKSFWDSLWFVHVTSFTVGYGDIFPVTTAGRIATMYTMWSTWILFAFLLALIVDTVRYNRDHFSHEEQEELKDDLDDVDDKTEVMKEQLALIMQHLGIDEPSKLN